MRLPSPQNRPHTLIQLTQRSKCGIYVQQTRRAMGTIPSPKDSQEVDKCNQPHGWMDVANRSTRLGVCRCPGPGAEGLKGGARPLALITALSLGGKVFGHERNPQDVANVYSSGRVEVEGKEAMLV